VTSESGRDNEPVVRTIEARHDAEQSIAVAPMTRQRAPLDDVSTEIAVSAEAYVDCPACADGIAGVLQPVDEPPMPTRAPATGGHLPVR